MPDWFYRTVSRPLLFRLPAEPARNLALGFMSLVARLPFGGAIIDFLGHMRADPRLARTVGGVRFPSPVGIGCGLDGRAVALPALARFGVGFLEIGPVSLAGSTGTMQRDDERQAILSTPSTLSLDAAAEALAAVRGKIPLVVRLKPAHPDELPRLLERLAFADIVAVEGVRDLPERCWRVVHADASEEESRPAAGFFLDGSIREGDRRISGLPAHEAAVATMRRLRSRFPDVPILAGGGIHEPEQALEMIEAGADLLCTDTGLIHSGPGLPKRINEALLHLVPTESPPPMRLPETNWFWTALMGAGMLLGGILALIIAATRVLLPYDESFVGMTHEQLAGINHRLLHFLAHDRVSLAGTMTAIGTLYLGLSLWGMRRGTHWAMVAVLSSAFAGFASFFLFLGYGYLDPFHAFVTVVLFQFLMMGVHGRLPPAAPPVSPLLRTDGRWRMAQWGQLLLIGHAAALIVAGLVIASFGITGVFVPEDLAFMGTTAGHLHQANPRLLPLIAHDRATFGGMLVSSGIVLLCSSLWGFRPSSSWLWWTWFVAVVPGYGAAIAVHWAVGYTDTWHLTPAYGGLGLFLVGMALSYPFLSEPGASSEDWAEWKRRLEKVR